jgi:septal ring-binding cell division protein DamX
MSPLWLAVGTLVWLAEPVDDKIVCVPGNDGKSWDCGRGANAPAPRGLPRSSTPSASPSAPPPYLINPDRLPEYMRGSMGASPAPAPAAAAPMPAAKAEPKPEPKAEPKPEPKPEPVAASAPVPAPAAQPGSPATAAAIAGSGALLALAPTAYTVQLAAARSPDGFAAVLGGLQLAADEAYSVRVRREGEDWWLLLWQDFPDLASAKAAAERLGTGYWPRRLAPLQAEVRATR